MNDKPLVIYHGNCMDGFTAAWACWLKHPDWEFYAATHGEPAPDVSGREVYLLDFSYKKLEMSLLAGEAKRIVVLDHHQSAEGELASLLANRLIHGKFDMQRSGAALAWEHFWPYLEVPKFVEIVEDRDLWRFALWGTREIAAAIFSYPYDFDVWNTLHLRCQQDIHSLAAEGVAIERKHHKDIVELLKVTKTRAVIGGHSVPVANLPYTMASDAANHLSQGEPFAATWYETATHRVYSLRSQENGLDVAVIAQTYGGGGHKHAAGYRVALAEVR